MLLIPSTLTEYSPSLSSESIEACQLRMSLYFNFGTVTTLRRNGDKKTGQSRAQKPPLHSSTVQAQTTEASTGDIPNKHNCSFFGVSLYTYFSQQYPPTMLHSVIRFVPFVDLLCLASDLDDPVQLLAHLSFLCHVYHNSTRVRRPPGFQSQASGESSSSCGEEIRPIAS